MRFDIKLACSIRNVLNRYIDKRIPIKPTNVQKENLIWENLFNEKKEIIHELNSNLKINLYPDSILCKLIYFGFEEDEIVFLRKFLKENDTFFDIGSNIGLFSLHASTIVGTTGQVHAFEPTPATYKRLVENMNLNSLTNIKANNIGLSNTEDEMTFYTSVNGFDAWNSFAKLRQLEVNDPIKVNVTTLDKYVQSSNISNIKLIKIDVEGWELFVMQGGIQVLTNDKPPVFLIEFTEENAFAAGYYCGNMYDYLADYGYKWGKYDTQQNKVMPVKKNLHYPYENLIAAIDLDLVNQILQST